MGQMSRDWTTARDVELSITSQENAPDDLNCEIDADYALYMGANGDGVIVEGTLAEIETVIKRLQRKLNEAKRWEGDGV